MPVGAIIVNGITYDAIIGGKRYSYPHESEGDLNTLFLLHGDSLNDASMYGVHITNNGVQISAEQSKFGKSSLKFDGDSYLSFSLSDIDLDFNSDWTLEWWEMPEAGQDKTGAVFCMPTGVNGLVTWYPSEGKARLFAGNSGWNYIPVTFIGTLKPGQWTHRAICKKGDTVYCFDSGSLFATVQCSGTLNMGDHIGIGYRNTTTLSSGYIGYLEELRISNIARWTESFTPSSEPYN